MFDTLGTRVRVSDFADDEGSSGEERPNKKRKIDEVAKDDPKRSEETVPFEQFLGSLKNSMRQVKRANRSHEKHVRCLENIWKSQKAHDVEQQRLRRKQRDARTQYFTSSGAARAPSPSGTKD